MDKESNRRERRESRKEWRERERNTEKEKREICVFIYLQSNCYKSNQMRGFPEVLVLNIDLIPHLDFIFFLWATLA